MNHSFAILRDGQYYCSFWTELSSPSAVLAQWKQRWEEAGLRLPEGKLEAVEEK